MGVVGVDDIHYDCTLLSAQLELIKADPTFIVGPGNPLLPSPPLNTNLTRLLGSLLHAPHDSDAIGSTE